MPDKITTLKLIDNTDVFPNIKDENIPDTIMRIADLSKYLNINTGAFDPTSDNPAGQKSIADRTIDLSKVVDSKGRPRFIQGTNSSGGFAPNIGSITYGEWSLSGTHLMAVIAGSIKANVTIHDGTVIGHFELPKWVTDKIAPVWANTYIEAKNISLRGNDWSEKDVKSILSKGDISIDIVIAQEFTNDSTERHFRIQYDLLIDTD